MTSLSEIEGCLKKGRTKLKGFKMPKKKKNLQLHLQFSFDCFGDYFYQKRHVNVLK